MPPATRRSISLRSREVAIKILIANEFGYIVGGRETYLRSVIPLLRVLGHEIGFAFEHAAKHGVPSSFFEQPGKTWLLPAELDRAVAWNPDVIYLQGLSNHAIEAQLVRRFPTVYFPHGYFGTCISGYKRHAWPSPKPCCQTFGLSCLAYYFPRRCGGLNPLTMVKDYMSNERHLEVLRRCARLQVASEAMRQEYLRHGFSVEQVALNPLFPANGQPDPKPSTSKEMSGIVLMAGRLTQMKGGEYLIKAIHRVRQVHPHIALSQLAFAGDGPDLARLRALSEKLCVPTQFHGWVNGEKLKSVMRSADVLAMPSLWPEPFGLLGLEAGCFGVPSVGFAHGGIPDWLVEGKSGALAPSPPSVEGLTEAIVRAMGDAERHQRLRLGAWEMANSFNADAHLRRLNDVLHSVAHQ